MEIIYLEETNSTNVYVQQLLSNGKNVEEGTLVWTGFQTAGRGQSLNTWESEKDANLTFSILLCPDFLPVTGQFLLSQVAALGIVDFLSSFCKLQNLSIKWPNDIYWKDKKICGMLIENLLSGTSISHAILGIGININQTVFKGDAPNPVSVRQINGETYDLNLAIGFVRDAILKRYMQLLRDEKGQIRKDYTDALYRGKGYFIYKDKSGDFLACIKEIRDTGILVLETDAGEKRAYAFKEVAFVMD
jgi:BirA family biotin operon repressor/biotin-[acetyl-CoA-carboxylase] ligase